MRDTLKILASVCTLSLLMSAAANAQFTCTTNNGTLTITGYTGPGGDVAIPDSINGLPVTSIGDQAFRVCTNVTKVTVPNSVTNIGNEAFTYCWNLTNVTIPKSVTSIGSYAFDDCTNLTAISVDASNPAYTSVDGILFNKSQTSLVQYPGGKAGAYTVPDGVASIWFEGCANLTSVTLPSSVTSLGYYRPFYGCPNLHGIFVKGNAPPAQMWVYPFVCSPLAIIYYLPGTTGWGTTFWGRPTAPWNATGPYIYATNSDTITITGYFGPGGVVAIPSTINGLPITRIADTVFQAWADLTNITLPNGITSIAAQMFNSCINLTNVSIPNTVTTIGDSAFANCSSLASLTIPNAVTAIGGGAFQNCSSLSNLTLPNSAITIGGGAFQSCSNLASLIIPNGVTNIADWTFASCTSLTNVTIPSSVTGIGLAAFLGCTNLARVIIPDSVTTIGHEAFLWCSNLVQVCFDGNAPKTDPAAFLSADKATVYYLSGTAGWRSTLAGRPTALWNPSVTPTTLNGAQGVTASNVFPGQTYELQASADLTQWTSLTQFSPSNAVWTATNVWNAAGASNAFFRLRMVW